MGRWIMTFLLLAGSLALTEWLPFSPYFRNVVTMIHEFGHAAVTLLLSGQVQYIHLYADHSGVTLSALEAGWRVIPVALAGYVTASLFAVLLFLFHRHGQYRTGLLMITGIAIVSLILFVRNDYGAQWLLGFIALNIIAVVIPISFVRTAYYLLIAFLCLVESVMGGLNIAFIAFASPDQAGDATNLARITGVPALVWGLVFALFSLWAAKRAIGYFLPKKR